ncbi:cytochrome P450 [Gymnopus androsaceus JB14]|uniref:Cytochrome P450 n=1 Tax=Gymnopus androsaceus JB14 TaxID=1447944 RepID=A0A6A4HVQ8_9AGAR|nr:cytochrome P450 [Gymnopus androsaceus JB14]
MISLLFGLAILAILLIVRVFTKSQKHLPPGPRGLPILGNVLQLGAASWLTFDKWKYEYGPIVYLNMAGQHIVVLNTKVAATELLERRSAMYSDRPRSIVGEYLGCQLAMPFARYGKLWQSMRRAGHAVLNARVSAQYQPVQTDEAVILAHSLLRDTSTPLLSKIHGAASTIISVIYGKQSLSSEKTEQNELIDSNQELQITSNALDTLSNIAHRYTNALYPGAHLVEVLPILDYLPEVITKWKRDAKRDFKRISDIFEKYFDDSVQDEHQRSSLCVSLANEKVTTGLSDVEQAWVAGSIAVSSVETTSTTLSFFLYAMILHPNVQEQAQKELDRVVGRARNPTFSDMPFLPYVRAIVKEVLRWQPAIPLAVPHILMEDDWYEGYFIPKGTSCIPNVWSMNRDKEVYGVDADKFHPERFLRQSESETGPEFILRNEYEVEDGHCAYGFGRRVCVGRHVADNALFIDICIILWALCIKPKAPSIDATRVKRGPSKDILNPIPDFQCSFLPRFPEAESLLQTLRDDIVNGRSSISS